MANARADNVSQLVDVVKHGVGHVRERTVEIGSRVLWIDNIGSLVILRGSADLAPFVVGAVLLLAALFMFQSQVMMGVLLAAGGVALIVYGAQKKIFNGLSIGTSDGRSTLVVSDDEGFLQRTLDLLRDKIDTGSITLQGTFDIGSTHVNSGGGGVIVGRDGVASGAAAAMPRPAAHDPAPAFAPLESAPQPPAPREEPSNYSPPHYNPPRYDDAPTAPEKRGIPTALYVAAALALVIGLGAGGYSIMQDAKMDRAAAGAESAAQAEVDARDAAAEARNALHRACTQHPNATPLVFVLQDCAELVWSDDAETRNVALANLDEVTNRSTNASGAVPLPQVPPVFIDENACPGEGCMYGVWTARSATPVFDAPDGAVIATVAARERVIAWRGDVYTTPVRGIVRTSQGPYRTGEEVYLLTYRGEGFYRLWHAGAIQADGVQVIPCEKDQPCDQPFDFGPFEQQSRWWAQVRRQNGENGWIVDTQNFDGNDRFG